MEHIKNIVAWELMFILVFSSLLVISSVDESGMKLITGMAIQASKEEVLTQLEEVIPKLDFINDVGDANMCLIVNMDATTKYSYEIVKIQQAVAVTASDAVLCKGAANEDIIISYVSYDKLKEQLDSPPTFQQLKQVSGGQSFYIYPSKQILAGMQLANPQEFNEKFGAILEKNFNAEERQQILNPSTPESRQAASFASYIYYVIVGMIVLVGILLVFVVKFSKKPEMKEDLELTAYIRSMMAQGYSQEQIQQTLLQGGWGNEKVQEAFKAINPDASAPQTPAKP